MSADQNSQKDGEVSSGSDRLSAALTRAGLLMITPAILGFLWLGVIREPLSESAAEAKVSAVAVETKASLIALYVADLEQRATQLSEQPGIMASRGEVDPSTVGFPDASRIALIPLDDLGTVNLSPGDPGVKSHIDIDIVRRAFAGDAPQPEFVALDEGSYTLFARGLGTPVYSVLVIEVANDRLEKLVANRGEGQYRIVQALSGRATTVAGTSIICITF